ncbi:flagellar protein FlaG [Cupriavidus sp. TA19]|uniref:flagellar protein FlaG n=1 Tax=unclassified Cupriavidus TaxID=2640874 RepID=UPI0027294E89|nr:flagellar protein FlaG [Cupriavidus sp. TA19]GLC94521.1 flagellar protein FlaG [Cupriavidus sp. TA19]
MATAATTPTMPLSMLAVQPTEQPDRRVTGVPAGAAASAKPGNGAKGGEQPSPSLDAALARLTEALRTASVSVQFEIDNTGHRVITKVMDKASGEVIRQIPTEELVRISDAMSQLQGLFVNQTA